MMSVYKTMHQCIDKPAYPTLGEALRKYYSVAIRKGVLDTRLHPYSCPFHPTHIHIGKTRPRRTN